MSKKWIYITAVAFLVVIGILIVIGRNKSTLGKDLSVQATQISKWDEMVIKKADEHLTLNYNGQKWTIRKTISASKLKIDLLKDILANMTVKFPVTGPKGEALVEGIKKNGINVVAKVKGEEVYQIYLQSVPDEGVTYVYQPGHKYVLSVYEPGTNRNIADFFTTDYAYWRDNTFIALSSDEITSIQCVWLADSTESFSIERMEDGHLNFTQNGNKVHFDYDMVKFYLYEFKNVSYEMRLSKENGMAGEKLCELHIASMYNKDLRISLYQKMEADGVSSSELLVYLPQVKEWGVITYLKANPILQKASFFLKK